MKANVTISHGWYGCDTGCCGHWVTVAAPAEVPDSALPTGYKRRVVREVDRFFFEHPYDAPSEEFAGELMRMLIREARDPAAQIIETCGGFELVSVEMSDE